MIADKSGFFTKQILNYCRTNQEILQNKRENFTEQMWIFTKQMWIFLQNKCGIIAEQIWKFYRTNVDFES